MTRAEKIVELQPLPFLPHGNLVEHVANLRPLTTMVLPAKTRAAVDHVLAENYQAKVLAARGLRPSNRLLFYGPPGCGKTAAAGAIALALGVPLARARLDALIAGYLGTTAANLRLVFDFAKSQPLVLLLDEVDALGRSRDDHTHDVAEMKRVTNSLLVMLEDLQGPSLVIAATNHEQILDPALWRRFDEVMEFPRPTELEIAALVRLLLEKYEVPIFSRLSLGRLHGMSFADVERVVLDAVKALAMDPERSLPAALAAATERQQARRAVTRPSPRPRGKR